MCNLYFHIFLKVNNLYVKYIRYLLLLKSKHGVIGNVSVLGTDVMGSSPIVLKFVSWNFYK